MRSAGILLPISALPSPHGIGTLGRAAYDFVDFLATAGQSLWQILPVGPTGFGDSPYQSFSAFAGNPYNIDLDLLAANGLLLPDEIGNDWGDTEVPNGETALVDYGKLFERRLPVLARACARQNKTDPAYLAYCDENAAWLDDYALYMAIKEANGQRGFTEWPDALRRRLSIALKAARAEFAPRIEFWRCVQFFFHQQWYALKSYANARGVGIVGDISIYVSDDSSDLWANPQLFQLDDNGRPARVAGVPPDDFSDDGQLWGNPLYDWRAHKRTRYAWWLARLTQAASLFDITRIDHFRGFAAYWSVPANQTTAKNGRWVAGPGIEFIRAVHKALPDMKIIAEDLGFLTNEVQQLLKLSGYPGMKVLQFAFDSREESDYLPHNYPRGCVVYTGTHDNTTTRDWALTARPEDVKFARRYLGLSPRQGEASRQGFGQAMTRAALSSVANTAIIPMQDWLGLGAEGRFNTPATQGGRNWRWRLLPGQLTGRLAERIRLATRTYGRLSDTERDKERYAAELLRHVVEHEPPLPGEVEKAVEKKMSMTEPPAQAPAEGGSTPGGAQDAPLEGQSTTPKAESTPGEAQSTAVAGPRVLTAAEMRAAEQAAVAAGSSYAQLMENAGQAAAAAIEQLAGAAGLDKRITLLCGKGNNAGDAFVVARLLSERRWQVQVVPLCGTAYSQLAAQNLEKLPAAVQQRSGNEADYTAPVIVDGVFGTGYRGILPDAVQLAFAKANAAAALRVALDVPSGVDCDSGAASPNSFEAAHTLTFGAYKPALMMEECCRWTGQVQLLDIGL